MPQEQESSHQKNPGKLRRFVNGVLNWGIWGGRNALRLFRYLAIVREFAIANKNVFRYASDPKHYAAYGVPISVICITDQIGRSKFGKQYRILRGASAVSRFILTIVRTVPVLFSLPEGFNASVPQSFLPGLYAISISTGVTNQIITWIQEHDENLNKRFSCPKTPIVRTIQGLIGTAAFAAKGSLLDGAIQFAAESFIAPNSSTYALPDSVENDLRAIPSAMMAIGASHQLIMNIWGIPRKEECKTAQEQRKRTAAIVFDGTVRFLGAFSEGLSFGTNFIAELYGDSVNGNSTGTVTGWQGMVCSNVAAGIALLDAASEVHEVHEERQEAEEERERKRKLAALDIESQRAAAGALNAMTADDYQRLAESSANSSHVEIDVSVDKPVVAAVEEKKPSASRLSRIGTFFKNLLFCRKTATSIPASSKDETEMTVLGSSAAVVMRRLDDDESDAAGITPVGTSSAAAGALTRTVSKKFFKEMDSTARMDVGEDAEEEREEESLIPVEGRHSPLVSRTIFNHTMEGNDAAFVQPLERASNLGKR